MLRPMTEAAACPSRQAFTVWPKALDPVAVELEVDGDGRAAQLGMGGRRGVGVGQPLGARDVGGKLQDALVVDLAQLRHAICAKPRTGVAGTARAVSLSAPACRTICGIIPLAPPDPERRAVPVSISRLRREDFNGLAARCRRRLGRRPRSADLRAAA